MNDEAVTYLSKLRKLTVLSLRDTNNISSYGFATLLHALPDLLSLGHCDLIFASLGQFEHCTKHNHRDLKLQELLSDSPVTEEDLELMSTYCPRLTRISIVYRPHESTDQVSCPHLSHLNNLPRLRDVSITSADFFNHSVFSALKMLGERLTRLELVDCDEMNIVSLIMIGEYCQQLSSLSISRCHFNVDSEQRNKINELCSLQTKFRSTPFFKLQELKFILTSPVHVLMIKYPLHYCHNLEVFSLELAFTALDDGFVNTLVEWSSWQRLKSFDLRNFSDLTLMSVNTILTSCPVIRRVGDLSTWGGVEREQLELFKQEIVRRNWDFEIS